MMTELHTGFTGTRRGMTPVQARMLFSIMGNLSGWWHHGDCLGADAESHEIALRQGLLVVLHPPVNHVYRAWCKGATGSHAPKGYISRNHDLVGVTSHLIAAPQTMHETARSGTWSTVRYARKIGRPITIIYPDGSLGATQAATTIPGHKMYWRHADNALEMSVVVDRYLSGQEMSEQQIRLMREYLTTWINDESWKGALIDPLRTKVLEIRSRENIEQWLAMAERAAIDPL